MEEHFNTHLSKHYLCQIVPNDALLSVQSELKQMAYKAHLQPHLTLHNQIRVSWFYELCGKNL